MSSLQCEFCSKFFSSISSINHHKKTAVYCLNIRNNIDSTKNANSKLLPAYRHSCDKCLKKFTTKDSMAKHSTICKVVNIEQLVKSHVSQIQEYKTKLLVADIRLKDKQEQIDALMKIIEDKEIASKEITLTAITRPTTNINNTIRNQNINNLKPLSEGEMLDYNPMLTIDHIKAGPEGYAQFAIDYSLKDRIACADRSRKKLAYKDESGTIIYDNEGRQLSEKFFKVIQDKNQAMCGEVLSELNSLIDEAQDRDDFEEAEVIIDLTDKIRKWRRQATQAGDGKQNELTGDFIKALCKISVK